MGAIDVDPSSDPEHHIPATIHYTKKEDGLRQPWNGRAYLNPEYGRDIIKWFLKLSDEMQAGRCTEAIVLWKAALETRATDVLVEMPQYQCSAVPKNRINFTLGENESQKRNGDSSTFTPIFHYFGPNEDRFIKVFGQYCRIWKVVKNPWKHQMALVKPIKEQLAAQGITISEQDASRFERIADAIILLHLQDIIPDSTRDKAREKLMKRISKAIHEANP
jgi:hypothetical protein